MQDYVKPDCYCTGECRCTECGYDDPASECCECPECSCACIVVLNPQPLDPRPMLVVWAPVSEQLN